MSLNPKQTLFCEEYLKDLNATQAAIRAGYSERTANEQGARLLAHVSVSERINELKAARSKAVKIDAEYVLKQLADFQQAEIEEIINDDGALKDVSEWPSHWQRMVVGIDVEELFEGRGKDRERIGCVKKVKIMDRAKVMEMMGRHINVGAYAQRIDVHHHKDGASALAAARNRMNSDQPAANDAASADHSATA